MLCCALEMQIAVTLFVCLPDDFFGKSDKLPVVMVRERIIDIANAVEDDIAGDMAVSENMNGRT